MQKTYTNKEIPDISFNKCSVIYALELVGGKWKLPIIWKLSKKKYFRYNELKRELSGITNTMLTRSLRELEECDIVKRIEYNEIPPRVEYYLTYNGKKLLPALEIIGKWGREQINNKLKS